MLHCLFESLYWGVRCRTRMGHLGAPLLFLGVYLSVSILCVLKLYGAEDSVLLAGGVAVFIPVEDLVTKIHRRGWFYTMRVVGLSALLIYCAVLLLLSTPSVFSQPQAIQQVQRELSDHEARIRSGEEFRRDIVAMQLGSRLAVVEKTVSETREELAWIGRLTFATLLTVMAWLLKEVLSLMQARRNGRTQDK